MPETKQIIVRPSALANHPIWTYLFGAVGLGWVADSLASSAGFILTMYNCSLSVSGTGGGCNYEALIASVVFNLFFAGVLILVYKQLTKPKIITAGNGQKDSVETIQYG